jgi:hypothetical protein
MMPLRQDPYSGYHEPTWFVEVLSSDKVWRGYVKCADYQAAVLLRDWLVDHGHSAQVRGRFV